MVKENRRDHTGDAYGTGQDQQNYCADLQRNAVYGIELETDTRMMRLIENFADRYQALYGMKCWLVGTCTVRSQT